jgi:hypothetical protein
VGSTPTSGHIIKDNIMLPIDKFEKSIITFGVEASLEYFGVKEGTTLYQELYDGLKETEYKLNLERKLKC